MKKKLNIALVQADLIWENPKANRTHFTKKIKGLPDQTDIVILPEMLSTGFTMNAKKVAETMRGETVTWMKSMTLEHDVAIVGSLVIKENKHFYNRFLLVEPSGYISIYDKRHTFTLVGEDQIYSAGTEKVIIHYEGWKIRPLICYDLRFPVWSRNTEDYDVLIYVANWPKTRIKAWDILLQARAIENMCYCIGVNRVGIDGVNSSYAGHSAAYNVLGESLTSFNPYKEQIEMVTLEKRHISAYRNKLKFLDDRDKFKIS